MLINGTQLPYVSQELEWLSPTKWLHGVKELHPLEVSQLVAGEQGILQLGVGLKGVGRDDQVDYLFQRHLVQGRGHVAELLILHPDPASTAANQTTGAFGQKGRSFR